MLSVVNWAGAPALVNRKSQELPEEWNRHKVITGVVGTLIQFTLQMTGQMYTRLIN